MSKFKVGDIIRDRSCPSNKRTIRSIDPPYGAADGDMYSTPSYYIGPYGHGRHWCNLPVDYTDSNYVLDEESMVDKILSKYGS